MDIQPNQTWFLGANAPKGFTSLYPEFTDPKRGKLYILKGGPGCGKSTFMRKIAEYAKSRGLTAEEIRCSGDPDSLDGVYIPAWRVGYVDGTAPHVIEPVCPGGTDLYLNFSAFYDETALKDKTAEIRDAFAAYKKEYARAYKWISGAEAVQSAALTPYAVPEVLSAVEHRAEKLASRLFRGKVNDGETKRFLSALTCEGKITLWETADALAKDIVTLDNTFGLAPVFLDTLYKEARKRGLSPIVCPDPMAPDRLEHLILPDISLAFVSVTPEMPYPGTPLRHLRLDAMVPDTIIRQNRTAFRRAEKLYRALILEAVSALDSANRLHDNLEAIYHPHVDFNALQSFAAAHLSALPPRL